VIGRHSATTTAESYKKCPRNAAAAGGGKENGEIIPQEGVSASIRFFRRGPAKKGGGFRSVRGLDRALMGSGGLITGRGGY